MAGELTILNGASNVARSVASAFMRQNASSYNKLRLIDARPFRSSVYQWQSALGDDVNVSKHMARSVQSIDIAMEGSENAVYFTHDYFSMSSDKNSHLVAMAQLAKKHGIKNAVAVCPFEHDLAWTEDETSYYKKVEEAENKAMDVNPSLTILKPNLAFGE